MLQTHRATTTSILQLAILILLISGVAGADEIQVSLKATRTSGVAPLPVFFDATGTTITSGSLHDVEFLWDFGDSKSKHPTASGFTAAHVFEHPGLYNVEVQVKDASGTKLTRNVKISVSAFSGATY